MKFASLSILAVIAATPAQAADVSHRTEVVHEGRSIVVSYEPRVETKLRQAGIGPRSSVNCRWTSSVSVQRIALDAEQRPIAVLTRVVEDDGARRSGAQLGLCSTVSKRQLAAFGGDERKLRAWLAEVAASDATTLRTEFASLRSLPSGHAYAR